MAFWWRGGVIREMSVRWIVWSLEPAHYCIIYSYITGALGQLIHQPNSYSPRQEAENPFESLSKPAPPSHLTHHDDLSIPSTPAPVKVCDARPPCYPDLHHDPLIHPPSWRLGYEIPYPPSQGPQTYQRQPIRHGDDPR